MRIDIVCEMSEMNPLCVMRDAKKAIKKSTAINKRKLHMKRFRKITSIERNKLNAGVKKTG